MKILILGGAGYIGTVLVERLLKKDVKITVVDNLWFGNYLKKNKNLKLVKKDIRNLDAKLFKGVDTVIHLANIANDPMVELNQTISWEINVLSLKKIIENSIKHKIKKFIFASSGSVYGLKKEKKVTEELELLPISTYNKTKMIAERVLLSYQNLIKIFIIRPATVCGFSPRMRLDVAVNNLTFQALKNKKINIHGGGQIRPNIHMKDMCRTYEHFLFKNVKPGIYNAGFENISVKKIAQKIQKKIICKLNFKKVIDIRSYRQNSDKLIKTGFFPKYNVDDAIEDLIISFKNGILREKNQWYSVNWLKKKIK
jgi:nucleoside-diphosphate-sugar epimerase